MEGKLRVLHTFKRYMPITQNWAHRLMLASGDLDIFVYATYYEKTNFFTEGWHFADFGLGKILDWHRSLKKSGLEKYLRMFFGLLLPLIYMRNKKLLREYIRHHQIDIVHSHFGEHACEMEDILKGLDVQHVVSFYWVDYEKTPFVKPQYIQKYKSLFLSASAFICEGKHGVKTLARMGCPQEKLHVVHLGHEIETIPFVKRVKKEDSLSLVQIATMTQKKGHYYTIRSFVEAVKAFPNVSLTLVGSPRNAKDRVILEDIKGQIKAHNIEDKVIILPGVDFSKLYGFLADYDVFIHPSCYAEDRDCEGGAPVVLLDAQATGMPVISTRHCDIPEEVKHGISGLLSDEKDIESLARSIEYFYKVGHEEYHAMALNARKHVKENYDILQSGQKLFQIYKQLKPTRAYEYAGKAF